MLTKRMTTHLNEQINLEFFSSNLYLQMASWCEQQGLEGCALFLKHHANEEMGHMERLFKYINETGNLAVLGAIAAPEHDYKDIKDIFAKTLAHEKLITGKINDLAAFALEDKDYSTFNFLQWYVSEQHEEERLFQSILDKINLIGTDKRNVFFLDREIGKLAISNQA